MKKIFFTSLALSASLFAVDNDLVMATTTSTDNTGLLDAIYPAYKAETGVDVKWTAVGTGAALKLGENCDADILFVHSPKVEKEFVEKASALIARPLCITILSSSPINRSRPNLKARTLRARLS